jgi:hypothetical protein
LLLTLPALAEKPRRDVRLRIEDCTPGVLDLVEAYGAAALELGLGDTASTSTEPSRVELKATLACDHGVKANLTLRTADQSASRTVALDDVRTKDRPRVLALALAELVRAEWRWVTTGKSDEAEPPPGDERHSGVEAAQRDDAAPSDARTPAAAAASDTPAAKDEKPNASAPANAHATRAGASDTAPQTSPPERHLGLEVLARARELFEGPTFVYGAAVGTRWRHWSASFEALFGQARGELGNASIGSADACVGYELWHGTRARWLFSVEPAVAGGVTWANGTGANPAVRVSNTTAFYADARLALRTEFRSPSLSPTLSLEAGRAFGLAAQENGSTIAVTGGWFLGGSLGFVFGGAL